MPRCAYLLPIVVAMLASLLIAGCGGTQSVSGEGAGRFPTGSVQDWVSYADHGAVYTVVAEQEIPPPPEETERGEGLVGRGVTLRIDDVLWSAPDAPSLPPTLHMTALGWVLQDGDKRPVVFHEGPRVAVGERYVAPLVRVEDDPEHPEWWPLGIGAQLPLDDDRINGKGGGWSSKPRQRLAGRSVRELRALVVRQQPEPHAAKHRDLRPTKRIEAVLRDRGDATEPAPSERVP